MSQRGLFITFEGGEGCGKSTQIKLLAARLTERGQQVVLVREPGGTRTGERIREILLSKESEGLIPMAELLLYEAARAQIVSEVIEPALEAGTMVLCDRFYDSTVAYQGFGRGIDPQLINSLNATATGGLAPDLTLLLDIDPALGLARAMDVTGGDGTGDRMEAAGLAFHQRIREGFASLAQQQPERISVLDASGSIEQVASQVWERVSALLPL